MPFDIYSTKAQLAAIALMPKPNSFLLDAFCDDMGEVEDDRAIYDFRKGARTMAPIVHKGAGGVVMGRSGYETHEVGFCNIAPERVIDAPAISTRAFGEQLIGGMTPQERERRMLTEDLMDMRNAIQLRREWMGEKVLTTGMLNVVEYTNEGVKVDTRLIADYNHTQRFTPATPWGTSGAKSNDDMKRIADIVYEGLGVVDKYVMAADVAETVLADEKYYKLFDGRNISMGEISTKYLGQGVRFIGWNSDGIEMYSVSDRYLDDNGQMKDRIPSGMLIAGSKGCLRMYHGPVTQVEKEDNTAVHRTYIKKEVPLRYGSISGNAIKNRLTSCPTIVPFNVDGWCIAQVL